jgi:hypothetical protein
LAAQRGCIQPSARARQTGAEKAVNSSKNSICVGTILP